MGEDWSTHMSRIGGLLGAFGVLIGLSAPAAFQAGAGGLTPSEGFIEGPGGRVWYRIVGTGRGLPLLVLHGCCGAASYYLKPLAALADGRSVIFYDQLGTGHSDHPSDTTIWAISRRVEELARVTAALGLREFHLYGHSGGATLAVEYLLAHPAGIRSLILAGATFDDPRMLQDVAARRATLPDSIRSILERHEQGGTCDDPQYAAAQLAFFQRFHARQLPWSADIDSSVASSGAAMVLYRKLGGLPCNSPNETAPQDFIARLSKIGVPTLFISGQYDYTTPSTRRFYQRQVPRAELVIIPKSGHLTMQDEPARDLRALRDFLRRVERR